MAAGELSLAVAPAVSKATGFEGSGLTAGTRGPTESSSISTFALRERVLFTLCVCVWCVVVVSSRFCLCVGARERDLRVGESGREWVP